MSPFLSDRTVVIVVEDEAVVRELAVNELEEGGFPVVDFPTVDEALRYLQLHADETAVVFTDVQTPGHLSGLDLADIVSRQWPEIGMLITSGGAAVNASLLPRCAGFVAKPWRGAEILQRVRRIAASREEGEPGEPRRLAC